MTDPGKCLIFLIFIIVLQQVDGNIIGPKILGDSIGLPAFWFLFSLLLFSHLMGFLAPSLFYSKHPPGETVSLEGAAGDVAAWAGWQHYLHDGGEEK